MAIFLFVYGTTYHCIRIGLTGQRPLIYAVYAYDDQEQLPLIEGQTYRNITEGQYEWLRSHMSCHVSFVPGFWSNLDGNLECRTHGLFYHFFLDDPIILDPWEERQV